MSLRLKTLIFFTLVLALAAAAAYNVISNVLLESFRVLEDTETRQDAERVLRILNEELGRIENIADDWAEWAETYKFISGDGKKYAEENLTPASLANLEINFVIFTDPSGNLLYGKAVDLVNKVETTLKPSLKNLPLEYRQLLAHGSAHERQSGIALLHQGPVLLSSAPVLTSGRDGAISAILITGRYLDRTVLNRMEEKGRLELGVHRLDDPFIPENIRKSVTAFSAKKQIVVPVPGKDKIGGLIQLRDLKGKPIIVLKTEKSRETFARGEKIVKRLRFSLLLTGAGIVLFIFLFTESSIFSRLTNLTDSVARISSGRDPSKRISTVGKNEFAYLGDLINGLLNKSGEKELHLQAILDNIPDIAWLKGVDSRFIAVNESFGRSCGRKPEDLFGATDLDIWPVELAEKFRADDLEVIKSRKRKQVEELWPDNEKGNVWVETIKTPVYDSKKKIIGIAGIARDITKRKEAEKALRDNEERLRGIFENATDMIQNVTTDGTILFVNRSWLETLGYTQEEACNLNFFDIIHPESISDCRKVFKQVLLGGSVEKVKLTLMTRAGTSIPVEGNVTPVLLNGRVLSASGFFQDISERVRAENQRKDLEDQLFQAQKMESLGTLAGGIAHDFNNILTPIMIETGLAISKIENGEPAVSHLQKVLKASKRARTLAKQILSFSRKYEQEQKPVQISLIIKEALKLLRASIPSTIEIRQKIEDNEGMVLCSPSQIHQIIMNLCTNAYHAMQEKGGLLEVCLRAAGDGAGDVIESGGKKPESFLELIVSDTGGGIDESIKARIFDPYFSTKPMEEGTGLGLAVVHGIVTRLGGTIDVESEPGRGSVFRVILPKTQDGESPSSDTGEVPKEGCENILLIDDEPEVLEAVKELLEDYGYAVVAYSSSTEAIAAFRSDPDRFDLVITDQIMPKVTGTDLSTEMMWIKPGIPIIICTGYSDQVWWDKIRDIGIREFLIKPYEMKELAGIVRRVLDEKNQS